MQAFPAYLQEHLDRRDWKRADLARASGINETQLARWASGSSTPTIDNARQLADTLARPLLEVLLAAGILTADEVKETVTVSPDLRTLSNDELLREVDRRMAEAPRPAVQQDGEVKVGDVPGAIRSAPSKRRKTSDARPPKP